MLQAAAPPTDAVERRRDAPVIGAQVIYVDDAFLGRAARPYAPRLLAVDSADGAARVREFAFIDPESAVGLCGQHARAVFRSNTVERTGCELVLRRNGARVEGAVEGSGCASRINDAHHVERALRIEDDAVELALTVTRGDALGVAVVTGTARYAGAAPDAPPAGANGAAGAHDTDRARSRSCSRSRSPARRRPGSGSP
jgi:hypothetical protein